MNPIIPTWIFYAISALTDFKGALAWISVLIGLAFAGLFIVGNILVLANERYGEDDTDYKDGKAALKIAKPLGVIFAISMIICCLIPDEKTMYTMLANSYITPNNLEAAGGNIKAMVDYVFEKIAELGK